MCYIVSLSNETVAQWFARSNNVVIIDSIVHFHRMLKFRLSNVSSGFEAAQ